MSKFKWSLAFAITLLLQTMVYSLKIAKPSPQPGNHTSVDLVAEADTVQPGHSLRVGVLFKLEPGWHIYWQNPGDSGEPPRIEWKLPAGFSAGAIDWPVPTRMGKPPIIDYGYENQVLLIALVRVPGKLRVGQNVVIAARAKWLVCREICVPEQAELVLNLPVRPATERQPGKSHFLFEQTIKHLPKALPAGWSVRATSAKDSFVLTLQCPARISGLSFIPLEPDQIENSAPQKMEPSDHGARLTLAKSEQLLKSVTSLRGVVVVEGWAAYSVIVPVK
ncbi:MAG: protein-disulfide reductase DsbD domain-containing protein [Candidatus Acidiferrales bacterium]